MCCLPIVTLLPSVVVAKVTIGLSVFFTAFSVTAYTTGPSGSPGCTTPVATNGPDPTPDANTARLLRFTSVIVTFLLKVNTNVSNWLTLTKLLLYESLEYILRERNCGGA